MCRLEIYTNMYSTLRNSSLLLVEAEVAMSLDLLRPASHRLLTLYLSRPVDPLPEQQVRMMLGYTLPSTRPAKRLSQLKLLVLLGLVRQVLLHQQRRWQRAVEVLSAKPVSCGLFLLHLRI